MQVHHLDPDHYEVHNELLLHVRAAADLCHGAQLRVRINEYKIRTCAGSFRGRRSRRFKSFHPDHFFKLGERADQLDDSQLI